MRETLEEPQEEEGFQKHNGRHDDNDELFGWCELLIRSIGNLQEANRVLPVYQAS